MTTMNAVTVAMNPIKDGYTPDFRPTIQVNSEIPWLRNALSEPMNNPVAGENMSQTTDWATPAMMKRLIPLPRPQPFWISSSISITMSPAVKSWKNIMNAVDPL